MMLSGSISFRFSGLMVAVLRGCRSFCTAAIDIDRVKITEVFTIFGKGKIWLTLTVFVHPHVETLLESAGLALVPVRLVNRAGSVTSLAPATIKYISIRELSA